MAALVVVFGLTRWPGLMPPNFSAAYALAFCAGVYFSKRLAWAVPIGTLLATDIALNLYYGAAFNWGQSFNYVAFALIILLGRRFRSQSSSWVRLVGGGMLGALSFYFVTNTASWLFNPYGNPEYTRTFSGWVVALTKGTAGYPHTWEFFRNTLLSGGLFTGIFVGTMQITAAKEPAPEESDEAGKPEESPA